MFSLNVHNHYMKHPHFTERKRALTEMKSPAHRAQLAFAFTRCLPLSAGREEGQDHSIYGSHSVCHGLWLGLTLPPYACTTKEVPLLCSQHGPPSHSKPCGLLACPRPTASLLLSAWTIGGFAAFLKQCQIDMLSPISAHAPHPLHAPHAPEIKIQPQLCLSPRLKHSNVLHDASRASSLTTSKCSLPQPAHLLQPSTSSPLCIRASSCPGSHASTHSPHLAHPYTGEAIRLASPSLLQPPLHPRGHSPG